MPTTPPSSPPVSEKSMHSTPSRASKKVGKDYAAAKQISWSGQLSTPPISQDDLKRDMRVELTDATWVMPAIHLARTLSRKTRTAREFQLGDIDKLDNYEVDLDKQSWKKALQDAVNGSSPVNDMPHHTVGESAFYTPLVGYFNKCLTACEAVIPGRGRSRYYNNLRFHEWDTPTQDGIRGAAAVKPDIVGGGEMPLKTPAKLWWRAEKRADTLEIPVEVKSNRAELIAQCATYARCLMDARPHRQFALVISYQQNTKELRFLVFHAGGLTASDPLDPTTPADHKSILRLFLSLLTWETLGDAGLPEWGNDYVMVVPKGRDDTEGIHLHLQDIIYDRLCLRGRGPKVQIVGPGPPRSPPEVDARTVRAERRAAAKEAKEKESEKPTSPLGPGGSKKKSSAGGTKPSKITSPGESGSKTRDPNLDLADLSDRIAQTFIGDEAARLCKLEYHANPKFVKQDDRKIIMPIEGGAKVVSKTAWMENKTAETERSMLLECKGQFGIVGLYQSGIVYHKEGIPVTNHLWLEHVNPWIVFDEGTPSDPDLRALMQHLLQYAGQSLVNVPSAKELFTVIVHAAIGYRNLIQSGFQHRDISIGNVLWMKEAVETDYSAAAMITKGQYAADILSFVKGMDQCHGFIIDGDMAIRINEEYFLGDHKGTRSGTEAFMSTPLLEGDQIWHSPVDDLWSLFYVAQWAAVCNKPVYPDPKDTPSPLKRLQRYVAGSFRDREYVRVKITRKLDADEYGPLLPDCSPFFKRWVEALEELEYDWKQVMKKDGPTPDPKWWLEYADKGVLDLLQLFKEFRDDRL